MIRSGAGCSLVVSFGTILSVACSPSGPGAGPQAPAAGNVRVFLADSRPNPDGIAALRVTLRGVSLLPSGRDGEIPLEGGPMGVVGEVQIDLSGNRSAPALLASQAIPPGSYRGVRLYVAAASAVPVSGPARALAVAPARIEVLSTLLVDPGAVMDLTLDLDAAASIGPPALAGAPAWFRPVVTMMPSDARAARP